LLDCGRINYRGTQIKSAELSSLDYGFDNKLFRKYLMDESKTIGYWVEIAEYDLQVAESMLEKKHYLYVGFMCHQSIEKILKAHYVKLKKEVPPPIHKLVRLMKECKLEDILSEEQKILLADLDPLNIQARYPAYKQAIYDFLSEEKAKEILRKTKEIWRWLRTKLS